MNSHQRFIAMRAPLGTASSREANARLQEATAQIYAAVKLQLPVTLQRLEKILDMKIPSVSAETRTIDGPVDSLDISLSEMGDALTQTRLHLSLDLLPASNAGITFSFSMSHLVVASDSDGAGGWQADSDIEHTAITCPVRKWPFLVHDVLLDIATFYSRGGPHNRYISFQAKRFYSEHKAAFVQSRAEHADTSFYGPIDASIPYRYLPLGCLCRTEKGFDAATYAKLWRSLEEYLRTVQSKLAVPAEIYISTRHPKGRIIGKTILRNLLSKKPPGSYALLRGESLPPHPPLRGAVLALFSTNRGAWHVGKLKVIPESDSHKYRKYTPFVSIFPFEIPQP